MAKQIATIKQTSGAGFTFEDHVGAMFLLRMLAGTPVLRPEDGLIQRVRFQKRVDGWFLDDVVLELRCAPGASCFLALSIKSNPQLTGSGFPNDFSEAIWEHRYHEGTAKFDLNKDYLGLVTATVDSSIKNAWSSLLKKAIDQEPSRLSARLAEEGFVNDLERAFFESLKCPASLGKSATDESVAELIRRIRHFALDFELEPSDSQNACISGCQSLLVESQLETASNLWTFLKQQSRELSSTGADISRTALADRIRPYFALREFPTYTHDWDIVKRTSLFQVDLVSDRLGDALSVERPELEELPTNKLIAFLGPSGCGKSSLAKQLLEQDYKDQHFLWLTSSRLNSGPLDALLKDFGLDATIPELLESSQAHKGLIVVDAVEQLNRQGLENVVSLIKAGRVCEAGTPWRVVITCVNDNWEGTFNSIRRSAKRPLPVASVPISFPFKEIKARVIESFPALTKILTNPKLQSLFNNLKVLDLVVSHAEESTDSNTWVGESDILDWYWDTHVAVGDGRIARSVLLQKLARIECERNCTRIAVHELDGTEQTIATGLVNDNILWNENEQLGFKHDLIADWSRQRFFVANEANVVIEITSAAMTPRWHRAIRLYGIRLLESKAARRAQWLELVMKLSSDLAPKLESDLVLEAVIFSANATRSLLDLWPELEKNEGHFLKRLLTRFLFVATLPHPQLKGTTFRFPYWPLWPSMLKALHTHRDSIIRIAPDQTTRIAQLWLQFSEKNWHYRTEASRILIDATRWIIAEENHTDSWRHYDVRKTIYGRLPTAIAAEPEETSQLLTDLVERGDESLFCEQQTRNERAKASSVDEEDHSVASLPKRLFNLGPLGPKWPSGPRRRINQSVAEGFLENGFPEVIVVNPSLAKELILALLIREPLPANSDPMFGMGNHFVHLNDCRDWNPGMFFHGPFLTFLRTKPKYGIATIVELINFATERWIEKYDPDTIEVCMSGQSRTLNGNMRVYFWYRDPPWQDNAIVCALMALEKWLYELVDAEHDISEYVGQILRDSTSVALFGVLCCVGKRSPRVFEDALAELLPIWQFQVWEDRYQFGDQEIALRMTMMQWSRWGESVFNTVRDWHGLEHRKKPLGDRLFELFLTNEQVQKKIIEATGVWQQHLVDLRANNDEDADLLEKLVLRFNLDNWKPAVEGNRLRIDFAEPEEVTARKAEGRSESERDLRIVSFHVKCRQLHEAREALQEETLESFWNELQLLAQDTEHEDPSKAASARDGVVGGITFLLKYYREWVGEDDSRLQFCWTQLNGIIASPSQRPDSGIAESLSNYHWDNFLALFIPRELCNSPDAENVRSHVVSLALAYHHSVVQDLMEEMFRHRDEARDDFLRLQRVVLISASVRSARSITKDGNSVWNTPDVSFEEGSYLGHVASSFVDKRLPTSVPSLSRMGRLAVNEVFRMVKKQAAIEDRPMSTETSAIVRKRIEMCKGFDAQLISVAFDWLKRIEEEADPTQRREWVSTVADFVQAFLLPLGGTEEARADEEEHNQFFDRSIPNQVDQWLFDLVSSVVPKLADEEHPERLWEPLLDFGLERHYWVEQFLSSWFLTNKQTGFSDGFFREWRKMIHYANSLANWRDVDFGRGRHESEKLFRCLMGFSNIGFVHIDGEDHRSQIASFHSEYGQWADEFLAFPDSARQYARFLCTPCAKDYVGEGLKRLADVVPVLGPRAWREHYHLDAGLMEFLTHVWESCWDKITGELHNKNRYMIILKSLSDRQVAHAMELQDQIAREPV